MGKEEYASRRRDKRQIVSEVSFGVFFGSLAKWKEDAEDSEQTQISESERETSGNSLHILHSIYLFRPR